MVDPTTRLCALWALRILAHATAAPALRDRLDTVSTEVTGLVGLPAWSRGDGHRFRRIPRRLREAEAQRPHTLGPPFDRLIELADAIALDTAELEVLCLAVAYTSVEPIQRLLRDLEPLWPSQRSDILAAALDRDRHEIVAALGPTGALRSSALLRPDHFRNAFGFEVHDRVVQMLLTDGEGSLLEQLVPIVPAPSLKRSDFDHLGTQADRLHKVLAAAVAHRTEGFDVLLYGPPGTGKTQLARWLVQSLGVFGLEVAVFDEDHEPMRNDGRLRSWSLAQCIASQAGGTVVVFDEAEDAFPERSPFQPPSGAGKGWFTKLLETHPVPTIWIANEVDHLHRAFLRRFDVVLHVDVPPRRVRRRMINRRLGGLPACPHTAARLAEDPRLSPAHLDRAVRAVELVAPTASSETDDALQAFLQPQLGFVGSPPPAAAAGPFDPTLSNSGHDLETLADALANARRGAVLLHGPPGTGKTRWVRYLAERADLPLVVCSPSTLLGSYVGQTERNLAATFARARTERAVLLIDEVDALLHDRSHAQQTWEVSQVNELLVQLDRFDGLVVCATNRLDAVDPAALRRFPLKVGFAPPTRAQLRRLVQAALDELGLPLASDDVLRRVDALEGLTPGDVEAVRRQLALLGCSGPEELVALLEQERRPTRRMGFAQP